MFPDPKNISMAFLSCRRMKLFLILSFAFLLIILGACQMQKISSFEECVAAGNPVMESYPRKCRAGDITFVELSGTSPKFHECTEEERQAEACTLEYSPVCALVDNNIRCITAPCASTDAVTSGNSCTACADKAYGYYEGECKDLVFVVCQETLTGFDPVRFAKDSGGICVDICPGNFDPYTTQTGIELCITHYGVEEISKWKTCERSTETCECTKTYETTKGEPIQDAEYRCVPKHYADRLIFRGGLDRLDENGERSVVIA
jgi:hypothetical protein